MAEQAPKRRSLRQVIIGERPSDGWQHQVEVSRARMGMFAVLVSDAAIAVAAILGIYALPSSSVSPNTTEITSILTTAIATIGTMTTAYFGIKSIANTAQESLHSSSSERSEEHERELPQAAKEKERSRGRFRRF